MKIAGLNLLHRLLVLTKTAAEHCVACSGQSQHHKVLQTANVVPIDGAAFLPILVVMFNKNSFQPPAVFNSPDFEAAVNETSLAHYWIFG